MLLAGDIDGTKTDLALFALDRGPRAPIAIAPGTGLGEAYLPWDGRGSAPHPKAGSHVKFGST